MQESVIGILYTRKVTKAEKVAFSSHEIQCIGTLIRRHLPDW